MAAELGSKLPVRVAIVDDDSRYRAGLEELVTLEPGFALADSYDSAQAMVSLMRAACARKAPPGWDLMLLDIQMPALSGIEALPLVKAALPNIKVVMLTVDEEPRTIVEAICSGADGYLLKKATAAELLSGVRAIFAGGAPLTPAVARTLLNIVRDSPPPANDQPAAVSLSDQETRVLQALARGLGYRAIADEFDLGLDTIRTYVRRIYTKLQTHTAAEAILKATKAGLI